MMMRHANQTIIPCDWATLTSSGVLTRQPEDVRLTHSSIAAGYSTRVIVKFPKPVPDTLESWALLVGLPPNDNDHNCSLIATVVGNPSITHAVIGRKQYLTEPFDFEDIGFNTDYSPEDNTVILRHLDLDHTGTSATSSMRLAIYGFSGHAGPDPCYGMVFDIGHDNTAGLTSSSMRVDLDWSIFPPLLILPDGIVPETGNEHEGRVYVPAYDWVNNLEGKEP